MSRSLGGGAVLVLFVLTACRLGDGAGPSPSEPGPPANPSASASSTPGAGISEQEAIEIASNFRSDRDATSFTGATSGSFSEVAQTMTNDHIPPDSQVWAVSFAGGYNIGCEYSDCPKTGTETVIIELSTGRVLMAQIYSPEE